MTGPFFSRLSFVLFLLFLLGGSDAAWADDVSEGDATPAQADLEGDSEADPVRPEGSTDAEPNVEDEADKADAVPAGQADLDDATIRKIGAATFQDLAKVIELCQSALRKGLDEDGQAFAKQLLVATLFDRANRVCDGIFERNPPSPRWPQLARAALIDLELTIRQEPKLAHAHYLISRIHTLPGGDRKRAFAAATMAIDFSGDDAGLKAQALTLRGDVTDDADKRLADYNAALELRPDAAGTLRARGLYFMEKNEHKKALEDFRRAVKLEPKHAKTHEALAIELLLNEKSDEALASLDAAIELAPDAASAYAHRARIFATEGKNKEALADINKALELATDQLPWRLLRAQIYQEDGNTKAALEDVERLLAIDAKMMGAIQLRAGLLAEKDQWEEAIAGIRRALEGDPDNVELIALLATFYAGNQQNKKAVEAFDRVLAAGMEHWTIYRSRGDVLLGMGQQAKAIADYEKALKMDPDNSGILNNLAWVLATSPDASLRDGKRAVTFATKAVELTENKAPHILSTLGAAYAETGDFDTAIEWAQKAVDLGQGEVVQQLQQELESYQAKKPWRENKAAEEDGSAEPEKDEPASEDASPPVLEDAPKP